MERRADLLFRKPPIPGGYFRKPTESTRYDRMIGAVGLISVCAVGERYGRDRGKRDNEVGNQVGGIGIAQQLLDQSVCLLLEFRTVMRRRAVAVIEHALGLWC